jgi:hypothetical protein
VMHRNRKRKRLIENDCGQSLFVSFIIVMNFYLSRGNNIPSVASGRNPTVWQSSPSC